MAKPKAYNVRARLGGYLHIYFENAKGEKFHVNLSPTTLEPAAPSEVISSLALERDWPFILYKHPNEGAAYRAPMKRVRHLDPRTKVNADMVTEALKIAKEDGIITEALKAHAEEEARKAAELRAAQREATVRAHASELLILVKQFVAATNDRFPGGFPDASLCSTGYNEPMVEAERLLAHIEGEN